MKKLLFVLALVVVAFTINGLLPAPQAKDVAVVSEQLLNGASSLNAAAGKSEAFMGSCRAVVIYIQWGAGTSAGAVQVESAHTSAYTGTWAAEGTPIAWTAASKEDIVQISGVHGAIRTRISTGIVGGTINTWITCN